ncbi:MAG: hypothetical protein M0038_04340 [Pseudomonadota bacterium]|jgi:hypothetical protein|nr:hypothetical protein [Pseudomonadota bacterium]
MKFVGNPQNSPQGANPSPADLSPTGKIRQLRAVSRPYAWDPYEVWRTRVKPKPEAEPGKK